MTKDIFEQINVPEAFDLNIKNLPKGIDNHHVDINLSKRFCTGIKTLAAELLQRETEKVKPDINSEHLFSPVCKSYADMMNVLIHRIKTDLSTTEINFLQFAVAKYVLETVSHTLNEYSARLKESAASLHASGSMESARLQNKQAWLRKHLSSISYRINRQIFDKLLETDTQHLHSVRSQYLENNAIDFSGFLSCAMLLTRNINASQFLIENYMLWGTVSGEPVFPAFNAEVENLLSDLLPELNTLKLRPETNQTSHSAEIFDVLKGFQSLDPYLGKTAKAEDELSETFCWFESPDNIDYLFDFTAHKTNGAERGQVKQVAKLLKEFSRLLKRTKLLTLYTASFEMPNIWSYGVCSDIAPELVCSYLAGQIKLNRLEDPALGGRALATDEKRILKKSIGEISRTIKKSNSTNLIRIMTGLSQFRLHLKYARFAHRIFNRLNLLTDPGDIQLSRQAGTLYQLSCRNEVQTEDSRIAHHTVLKADVRGSIAATEMLEKKALNPASHFSLHFFNPIREVLPQFGGTQVFLEGDAIILAFLEYENSPEEWSSVARACGLSKAILKIIETHNAHSRQMGLPVLEIGIGICFSSESPRYLFDSEKPVMISSAIGQADRLSSCSWQLREKLQNHTFNIGVLKIAADDKELGEKGKDTLQYNVNGILLHDDAFSKLQKEVKLHRLTLNIAERDEVFYCGVYSDVQGNYQDLVIREGRIGLWQNDTIFLGDASSKPYFEVIIDDEILKLIFEAIERSNM